MVRLHKALWERVCHFWETKVHFLELHYSYIAFMILISSALYYCEPGTNFAYIDVLFMATTGVTNTGLNTINMSDLSNWQLTLLLLNSFFCSHIIISFFVVMVRRYYFSKRFEDILLYNKAMQLREQHKRRRKIDIETGQKRTGSDIGPPIRRRLSFMSTHSTPVQGNTDQKMRSRRQSFDTHATRTNDIYSLITQFREYQNALQSKQQEYDVKQPAQQQQESLELQRQFSRSAHPCDIAEKADSNADNDLRRVTTATSLSGTTDGNTAVGQGIAFADNIERQREMARQRLERSRRLDELLQKIAKETGGDDDQTAGLPDDEDDQDYEYIMRQPIEKSQLTREQRYRIGGAEYRALDMLARIVACYYLGFIFGCGFIYRIFVAVSPYCQEVLATSNPEPTNPWLFSMFLSVSAMNNLGMSVLDASMTPFQNTPFPLIVAIILILAGNTAFAILLRFIIWVLYKLTPKSRVMRRETFRYLLDHPRRCFTTLFPATKTWWLLIVLIVITLVEVIAFLSLNYWLPVINQLPWPSRVLDGIFQSVATRNAGFSVVGLADINPGTQLVYIVAMYISVYPVAISMRNSNVYQERSLGIFRGQDDEEPVRFSEQELNGPAPFIKLRRHPTISSVVTTSKRVLRGPDFFVITQIQRQLTSDICWVIVGIFLISVIEAEEIMSPSAITMSTVIYECVSAFANVGASTGFPGTSTSQAGAYRTLSKLVLIALMYRGRHRGLPAAIDRAVLLPSEQLEQREEEDNMLRRRNTSVSNMNGPTVMFYNRSSTL
ncbi:hypothetical protein EC973_000956 [Apophysomyces ossiformis]|uniref:Potassium transport protein n=1 Tax=Apophysomyces ossiformis TaxID=679940 RepID=A0A8H7ENI6_9FUNG|nr:hypothetical protein EC973_000956 [Apophysomyces ossiformis]